VRHHLILGALALYLVPAAWLADTRLEAGQETTQAEAVSAELRTMYEADQQDRRAGVATTPEAWKGIQARDRERRDRVLELTRGAQLRTADDYYHAAMVLQHGDGSEDILIAHILATAAAFKGHERARWLSAAALDRYLHRTGAPQRLGTQYVRPPPDGPWSQGAYERWLPDTVRAEFGVPPLEAQQQRVQKLNAPSGGR